MVKKGELAGGSTGLRLYLESEHGGLAGWFRDSVIAPASFIPGLPGIALRSIWYRLWIRGRGKMAIEAGTRILGSQYLQIEEGVYLDKGVYLHGRPGGLTLGAGTRVMQGAILHVYNFRGLSKSGIRTGKGCVIGFNSLITGQGGVELEDEVIVAPGVMILPVNHNYRSNEIPIKEQGIQAKGIKIRSGAWIGAGAVVLDGVEIGNNAVIGAGSVVNKNVAPGAVVAGNPAKEVVQQDSEQDQT